ncbi:protein shifted-like isoform X1 [Ischnura elegans]|uniref:protein shifted-like isoform X1 n=1 Tax=Ischnura elegans TaxID=197161 RepID=UPI001ED874E4|nr:protein shifted-like isoform X1 [Ischnura elegans]
MWQTWMLSFLLLGEVTRTSSRGSVNSGVSGDDLSLWIDQQQVKMFSGFAMKIYAIVDGHVLPYILDPNFEKYLPIIPSEVSYVNFTWKSGGKKYYYNFDRLQSFDESILEAPVISVRTVGRVPRRPKVFSVFLPCSGNSSGIASFGIGLLIESRKGKPLPGTPLRLRLRKECAQRGQTGPDPECDRKCANGGWCNQERICQCPEGYMGQHCRTALCYPQCMNGGSCTSPGICSCLPGFQGRHCEGGICAEKCLNGGKCIQKDTCDCPKGYYGLRCEFSKCIIPCLNGGRCRGANKCRCPSAFGGDHCEIMRNPRVNGASGLPTRRQHSLMSSSSAEVPKLVGGKGKGRCPRHCGMHGTCQPDLGICSCEPGWFGKMCRRRDIARNHKRKKGPNLRSHLNETAL